MLCKSSARERLGLCEIIKINTQQALILRDTGNLNLEVVWRAPATRRRVRHRQTAPPAPRKLPMPKLIISVSQAKPSLGSMDQATSSHTDPEVQGECYSVGFQRVIKAESTFAQVDSELQKSTGTACEGFLNGRT